MERPNHARHYCKHPFAKPSGSLRKHHVNSGGQPSLEYNAVGQLKQKNLHDGLQGVSYLYNERGWLKEANNGLFLEHLNYNVPWHGAAPQYNGNIAEQEYQLPASGGQYFVYAYDKLNRLTSGVSSQSSFSEAATYDEMGNIASLNRDGTSGAYSYTGNRLNGVSGGWSTGTYAYDANGNATYDGRNGKTIAYNELNLPRTVTGGSTNTTYTYDAAGSKLRKQGANTTDYVDGIQYNNGSIEFIQTEEGIARNNGGSYTYEYFLKDHLGNTRVTFYRNPNNGQAEVLQQESYYPFGMRKVPPAQASSSETRYLYNGKELQEELGQLDYGARFYDPVIARWSVIDNKAELYFATSPYVYALNQPTNAIDPDGNLVIFINGNHFGGSGAGYWERTQTMTQFKSYTILGTTFGPFKERVGITQSFAGAVMNQLNDGNARYYDGSGGGFHPIWDDIRSSAMASGRDEDGYHAGKKDAVDIVANLARDKNNNIVESIKIITHSMGGAYGKGFVRALKEYIQTLPLAQQRQILISLVADFDPYQAGDLTADPNIKTMQFKHRNPWNIFGMGWLANETEKGDIEIPPSKSSSSDHSIFSFFNDISSLDAGKYTWDGKQWIK